MTDDGVKIYYQDYGDKNSFPLIFMHGWGVSSALFTEQLEFFSKKGYRTITFDTRGHGKSDKHICNIKGNLLNIIYNDFKTLINYLDVGDTFGFIGHSAGGACGIDFYFREPDNFKFLCLLNSSYVLYENFNEKIMWELMPILINLNYNSITKTFNKLIFSSFTPILSLSLNKPYNKVKNWIYDILDIDRTTLLQELKELKKYNLKDKLPEIKIPCLIIAGEYDILTPPKRSITMHKLIPNSELHIIPKTGHLTKIEKSEIVNNIILRFIEKHLSI